MALPITPLTHIQLTAVITVLAPLAGFIWILCMFGFVRLAMRGRR